jgi:DNA-binding transcriptional LysR family regulator
MDLDAKPYRAFVQIADSGSFTRAAEALHISQPALSAQIRELERLLGFALFHRQNRRVLLTAEGRIFLDYARRLIMETDWINKSARDIRENQLRIGAAHHSADIPARRTLVEGFMVANPKVPISIAARTHAQLFEDLRLGVIDAAITLELVEGQAQSAVEPRPQGFDRNILGERPLGLAIPCAHPLAQKTVIEHADLQGLTIATISRAHGISLTETVARSISAAGAQFVHTPEGDAVSVLRYAAAMGRVSVDLGWFEPFPDGMRAVPCPALGLATQLEILTHGEKRPATESFIAFARLQLREPAAA